MSAGAQEGHRFNLPGRPGGCSARIGSVRWVLSVLGVLCVLCGGKIDQDKSPNRHFLPACRPGASRLEWAVDGICGRLQPYSAKVPSPRLAARQGADQTGTKHAARSLPGACRGFFVLAYTACGRKSHQRRSASDVCRFVPRLRFAPDVGCVNPDQERYEQPDGRGQSHQAFCQRSPSHLPDRVPAQ
jgi:hypothetical protein